MDSKNKACIITAAIGDGWYQQGQERLITSLNYHGYPFDVVYWNEWPVTDHSYDKDCVYNVKAAAFDWALKKGYTHIVWMDCSAWLIKDLSPLLDEVSEQGYYLGNSGYSCAQTCPDNLLAEFGLTRDQAERISDCSSAIIGVNILNPVGNLFVNEFIELSKKGLFKNSREHNPADSQDTRFMFGRQDQSAASLLAWTHHMELTPFGKYVSYYEPVMTESTIIALRGM